jgi:AraC-like DNA-binding protein
MNLIESMDLGPNLFRMSHRNETMQQHWKMLHAHQGIELLYIYSGLGEIAVERQTFSLQPGTLVWFQPYQLHRVEVPPISDSSYIRTNVTFNPHLAESYLAPYPELRAFFLRAWKGNLSQQVFQLAGDTRIADYMDDYYKYVRLDGKENEEERLLFLIGLLRLLKLQVFPAEIAEFKATERTSRHIERMIDWLENHYSKPFHLDKMGRDLHLSPYHISHLFKQYTGTTVSDYLSMRRIREACSLLANTDMSIGEISLEIGGFSTSYFCQLFKKHKGMPPQHYRTTVRQAYQS